MLPVLKSLEEYAKLGVLLKVFENNCGWERESERARELTHGLNNEPVVQTVPQWCFSECRADSPPTETDSHQTTVWMEQEGFSERLMGQDPPSPRRGASAPKLVACTHFSLPHNNTPPNLAAHSNA